MASGYTGGLFEWELLGPCLEAVNFKKAVYMPFKAAMCAVKSKQPVDPTGRPQKPFAQALKRGIVKRLGVLYHEVKFYSAVGSSLDVFHGIDAFVEYRGKIVTMDVTMNSQKDAYKADFLITKDVYEAGPSSWEELAKDMANRLRA